MSFIETPFAGAAARLLAGIGRTAGAETLWGSLRCAGLSAAALLLLGLSPASAHEYEAGSLHIEHPWARATPPRAGVAGAYMVIENHGSQADRLLGGSTDAARTVQIHSMTMDGDVMKMRQAPDGLELPAGQTVTLAPGGYHLMLVDPVKPLKEGDRVPMTLDFEKAGRVAVDLAVEGMGATGPASPKDMDAMHHDHDGTAEGGTMTGAGGAKAQ